MFETIRGHVDFALCEYTTGAHLDSLLEAKKEYFQLTGAVNEEDDEFEARMNCFNDWYVFQYLSRRGTNTVIKDYLEKFHDKYKIDDETSRSLLNLNHSLYEFQKINFRGHIQLKDILHDKKLILPERHPKLAMIEGDLFTGRIVGHKDDFYLLKGLCILPKDVKSTLEKQCKRIRKLKDPKKEQEFLLQLEGLKTKWLRYGHIDTNKIFVFA